MPMYIPCVGSIFIDFYCSTLVSIYLLQYFCRYGREDLEVFGLNFRRDLVDVGVAVLLHSSCMLLVL